MVINKKTLNILVILVLFIVAILIGFAFLFNDKEPQNIPPKNPGLSQPPSENEEVFCAMDVKLCPNGSSVGRIGPNCEFAECPGKDAK